MGANKIGGNKEKRKVREYPEIVNRIEKSFLKIVFKIVLKNRFEKIILLYLWKEGKFF